MYPDIIGKGIPKPNEGIHNKDLPCIPPLLVKGFLGLVIFHETTPLSFKNHLEIQCNQSKRTPSHHGYLKMERQG